MNNSTTNLAQGNVYKMLISFGLPFLIANFIQALYGAVDLAMVGWFSGQATVAAVSIGTQVTQMLNSIISGLTMGGTILIAQYIGAKRTEDTRQTITTMLTMFAVSAFVFMAVMFVATPAILRLINTPAEAMHAAKQYVYTCSGGIFFIFGYNAISAVSRGMGDSRRPVIFIGIACVANILLDLLLVGGFGMGASGAAIATVLSQGVSLLLSIRLLKSRDFIFDFKLKSFRIHRDKALKIFKLGLPVSLQETILSVSFLFISAIVNSLGVVAAAATGICGKFESFAMLPASAFSGALAAIAGQNIGAGKPERAKKALFAAIILALCCSMFFFAAAQLFPESVMQLFKADQAVSAAGVEYMRTFSFDFILVCFGFCLNGFLNGCGRTIFVMINGGIASIFIRLPLAYILSTTFHGSLFVIGIAAPAATLISVTVALLYMRRGSWKTLAV